MNTRAAFLLLALVLVSVSGLFAQQWTLQSPLPLDRELECATFVDPLHGWAGNQWGDLVRTTDGGQTWSIIPLQTDERWITSLSFTDPLNGWATGSNNCLIHSTDGGVTWQDRPLPHWFHGQYVRFTSPAHGWLVTDRLERTIDGGANWNTVAVFSETHITEQATFVLDDAHIWVVTDEPLQVRRTTDGGVTWDSSAVDSVFKWVTDITFLDPLHGWMTANEYNDDEALIAGRILNTTDGGVTWHTQFTNYSQPVNQIEFADLSRGVASGEGFALSTSDGGLNWEVRSTPGRVGPICLAGLASGQFWGFCRASLILYSPDFGNTWQQLNNGISPQQWQTIAAVDSRHAWVGGRGAMVRTTDGGALWQLITITDGWLRVRDIAASDVNNVWAATGNDGAPGTIYYSADGGNTWTPQITNCSGPIVGLSFTDRDYGWAVGDDGIFNTVDGGYTWTLRLAQRELSQVYFMDWLNGWAAGNGNLILRTVDGGHTWTEHRVERGGLWGLHFADIHNGWIGTESQGTLLRTTDGGETWIDSQLPDAVWIHAMSFTDPLHGYATGTLNVGYSDVYSTSDGGLTWQRYSEYPHSTEYEGVADLAFTAPDQGWLVTDRQIFHATAIQSSEHEPTSAVPNHYSLSAYPNPFNPTTTILLNLPSAGRTTIGIYDITGRLVQTLADHVFEQGSHAFTFDGSSFSSGIYFARARSTSATVTQKLVLMK
jgi:photosystem II stability/assembly factor-like uncharacterized protein